MRVRIDLAAPLPDDVFARLARALAAQGVPPLAVRREPESLLVEGASHEVLLRCRALSALEAACDHDGWQRYVRL